MKTGLRILATLFAALILSACQRAIPENAFWTGYVDLAEGKTLPFRMSLNLAADRPRGDFLVGDEKTPIPEISINGDSMVFVFSEYGAEMRGLWNGSQWVGNYIRYRSGTSKSFPFSAVPETSTDRNTAVASKQPTVPQGNYQVHFQGDDSADNTTTAKFWNNSGSLYGTLIAPDGDYGLLLGESASNGVQFSRFTGWQATVILLEPKDDGWSGTFFAASSDKPRLFTLQPRSDLQLETFPKLRTAMKNTQSSLSFSCMSPS